MAVSSLADSSLLVRSTASPIRERCTSIDTAGGDLHLDVGSSNLMQVAIARRTAFTLGVHDDWIGGAKGQGQVQALLQLALPYILFQCWGIAPAHHESWTCEQKSSKAHSKQTKVLGRCCMSNKVIAVHSNHFTYLPSTTWDNLLPNRKIHCAAV